MSFWDSVFRAIFGSRGSRPTSPPPPERPPATPPRPPATPPAPPPAAPPPPVTPPAPPPIAPLPPTPPAPLPPVNTAPPPPIDPSVGFSLDALRATNAARLTDAEIAASAQRLGVEVNVLKAVIKVESAGPGFADNKPLLSFEPFWFSQATAGRFDASNPGVSQASNRAYLGGTQASRWSKLSEAFALDAEAALGAASWGAFQLPGRYFADAGYSDVFSFVRDMAHSEARQLAAFEAYISRKGLADELQRRDWDTFARAYEGENGAGQYSSALARAYGTLAPPPASDGYLDSLVAGTRDPLTRADFEEVAAMLGCEVEAIQAVVQVESGSAGAFAANGKPIILFEPHIFSRRTNRQYDTSHPTISYRSWDATKYPRTQDGRWAQLREAYALNPQEAIASASYGLFQIMGFNHNACGFPDPKSFVSDMCRSQAQQLKAFANFVRSNNLADELVRKDWEGFAAGYNGSGQVERYGRLMREAYERLKATS
ncbi:N-acetylmuramidase domain-containing protein [Vitreimonas sp.]|uniref:N-acetylmuramidase domain-containing protein n=1 Tax=Vitreimonas sp. TaxID=3069702 RepID=UPI002ED8F628